MAHDRIDMDKGERTTEERVIAGLGAATGTALVLGLAWVAANGFGMSYAAIVTVAYVVASFREGWRS